MLYERKVYMFLPGEAAIVLLHKDNWMVKQFLTNDSPKKALSSVLGVPSLKEFLEHSSIICASVPRIRGHNNEKKLSKLLPSLLPGTLNYAASR